jgi:hypothetical protein
MCCHEMLIDIQYILLLCFNSVWRYALCVIFRFVRRFAVSLSRLPVLLNGFTWSADQVLNFAYGFSCSLCRNISVLDKKQQHL